MILQAAQEIAAADPLGVVSILAIARHLKVTPMAIYTYFASKDALMQALTGHLLEDLVLQVPPEASPAERVRVWCYAIRDHFLRHPILIKTISWEGGRVSAAWLNKSKVLFSALRELDLASEDFAKTVVWLWNSVMVAIQVELYYPDGGRRLTQSELDELDPQVRADVQAIDRFTTESGHHERLFAFQVARLTDAIERLARPAAAV